MIALVKIISKKMSHLGGTRLKIIPLIETPPVYPPIGVKGCKGARGYGDFSVIVLVIFRVSKAPKIFYSLMVRIVHQY